ncbi:molybdopterin-dependent oxidoreductase [Rhodococcoides yunnanense]|uniref:molybdopterin-dependent oxidoreductase n=1 Tax=Rhodococcoides yunnanense TaxID=278209 RepID=UPI000932566B|nr:molybdopterin-dependent oxidoreductase [Rhodococcus yunnanensis]
MNTDSVGPRSPQTVTSGPRFRSPLRGPWLTSIFGAVLLVGLPIVIVTGLLSYIAYGPQFGQAIPGDVGWLRLPQFDWPTDPAWLYRLTQGLHVGLGLVLVPIVAAKLWSVIPKLFARPPVRSIAQALERLSLIALVGGILFEIVTGVLNIQYDYIFGFSFYTAHYWGAWIFIAGFVTHAVLKTPLMIRTLRGRSLMQVLQDGQEKGDSDLIAENPSEQTISRRGALALVGGGALFVAVLTAGQTTGGFLRNAAILLPRGRSYGDGPNDFQINRTASAAQITEDKTSADWTLELTGGSEPLTFTREALERMEQHTADLPIACVEGWSTVQTWTGVRLRDLATAAGVGNLESAQVTSLEENGPFRQATLQSNQVLHPDSLLALRVNGADLSPDHGYPARIIVPAMPGVHNTKWVKTIEFRSA